MGSRNKDQVGGQCVRSSEERGRGWLWGMVTTDHTNVSLEAAIRLFMCWGGSVMVTTDHTHVSLEAAIRLLCVGVGASGSRP